MILMQHEDLKSKGDARPGCEQGEGRNSVCTRCFCIPLFWVGAPTSGETEAWESHDIQGIFTGISCHCWEQLGGNLMKMQPYEPRKTFRFGSYLHQSQVLCRTFVPGAPHLGCSKPFYLPCMVERLSPSSTGQFLGLFLLSLTPSAPAF